MWPVVRTDPPNEIIRPPRMISSSSGSSPAEGSLESLSHLWWKGAGDLHSCLIAVRQLDESISLIAHEDKKDYLEAYQLNPILVATESNPIDFLRVESMNPWNAATRLTLYWKYRRGAFRDRWLLPLTLSGQGALSQSDVALLKQDVIVLQKLPGNSTLVFVDWTRGPNQDDFFPSRACFFLRTIVEDDEIYLIQTLVPKVFMGRQKKGRTYEVIRKALPVRMKKVFLLARETSTLRDSIIYTSFSMLGMLSEFFFGDSPELITDMKKKEAMAKLKAHGVPEACIPSFLGGQWDVHGSDDIAPTTTTTTTTTSGSSAKPPVGQRKRGRPPKVVSAEFAEQMKAQCDGDDDEFIKKRNALYSRRLYYKKKKQKGELRATVDDITEANEKLRQQNNWLEGLMAKAQDHISAATADGNLLMKAN